MPTVQPDDEVYRVNNIWLGPPGVTLFRARYVAWFIGIIVGVVAFSLAKAWFGLGFFVVAWTLVLTVMITRGLGGKITHERGLLSVLVMFLREISTPRRRTRYVGGAADVTRIRVAQHRPRPSAPAEPPAPVPSAGWPQPGAAVPEEKTRA